MELGTPMIFGEIPIGHYFYDGIHVWQSVKSGEVYKGTLAPESPVMVCRYHTQHEKVEYEIGEWIEDCREQQLFYLGKNLGLIERFVKSVREQEAEKKKG